MRKIIIAGSEGLIGKEVSRYFEENACKIIKLDLTLGNDLNDEFFVHQFFQENKADYLINLFALNDHVDADKDTDNIFDITLSSFEEYLKVNVLSLLYNACQYKICSSL